MNIIRKYKINIFYSIKIYKGSKYKNKTYN